MRTGPLLAHYRTAPLLYFTRDKQSEHEQSSPNVKLKVLLNFLARLQATLGSGLGNVRTQMFQVFTSRATISRLPDARNRQCLAHGSTSIHTGQVKGSQSSI